MGDEAQGDQLAQLSHCCRTCPAVTSHTSTLHSCHLLAELQMEREMQYLGLLAPGLSEHFSAPAEPLLQPLRKGGRQLTSTRHNLRARWARTLVPPTPLKPSTAQDPEPSSP